MMRAFVQRLWRSGVAWSWVFNGVRLVFGLILLPLLVVKLSDPDFGMYQIFANTLQMLPLVDATLSFNVGRQVTFAMGGATRLLPLGTDPSAASGQRRNRGRAASARARHSSRSSRSVSQRRSTMASSPS